VVFKGFSDSDFEVFSIDGLDPRMTALKTQIRPKLEALGEYFTPRLTDLTHNQMVYHVAKHARRTVNPPKDTWVAFAANARGYKKHPHFQIGLWPTHVFIRLAVINECPDKETIAKILMEDGTVLMKRLPKSFVWSDDHTKPDTMDQLSPELLPRLGQLKKAEFLVGLDIPRKKAVKEGEAILQTIQTTFNRLAPLYSGMTRSLSHSSR
jgi:uncharacterized protein YktB (UPF0637 family)